MEAQTGGKLDAGDDGHGIRQVLRMPENAIVNDNNQIVLKHNSVGTIGNEIAEIFIKIADGTLGKRLTQNSIVSENHYTYDPETNIVQFDTGMPKGTEVVAYYDREIITRVLDNPVNKFSGAYPCYIDFIGKDECQQVFWFRYEIPLGEFSGTFNVTGGNSVGKQDFTITALSPSGKCPGSVTTGGKLWYLYVMEGDDPQDAPAI